MSTIGHNGGPSMEPGFGFRKLAWTRARAELMPTLPLEVVRLRVKRAARLGLPYKTYATIRATSGQDIVGFLFSGNALELRVGQVALGQEVMARLAGLEGAAHRLAAIYAPSPPEAVLAANPGLIDAALRAPGFTATWRETRDSLRGALAARRLPCDGVVLVAATAVERGWGAAAGLGGVIDRDILFAAGGAA
ncbi:hypothetical protein [Roseicyclus mahoneyensis]|uniref:Uncharacterized protein n=1 Tax=Roseicyclus mahoneyensis TaxID=164332 RepID=A0A316GK50_9RHOB|nr:hypothetical protein [Roseicyclus mahoneyensis]PWK60935.1 hypothetical protein C7455_103133 [Roseicyclus mahoneyensis]